MRMLVVLASLLGCASSPPPPPADPAPAPAPVASDPAPAAAPAEAAPAETPVAARKRPPPPCADPSGASVISVARIRQGTKGAPEAKTTITLFDDGAWQTVAIDGASQSGCVADDEIARLRGELAGAPWQITHARFRCMAISLIRTEYSVHDKVVWQERICSGESLDKASAAAIADVDATIKRIAPEWGQMSLN